MRQRPVHDFAFGISSAMALFSANENAGCANSVSPGFSGFGGSQPWPPTIIMSMYAHPYGPDHDDRPLTDASSFRKLLHSSWWSPFERHTFAIDGA